ncbi:ATP-binding protein [Streptomyces mirabilis]|uniref:ATP-binding protein n=1 Tax=Streptomyces mirabilis TaxID=68239 RepID=UPI0037F7FCC1
MTRAHLAADGASLSGVFRREPTAVRAARHVVRDALGAWELTGLTEDAEVVISELATNAVLHARMDSIRVTVTRIDEHTVRLAVVDRSRDLPVHRSPNTEDMRGRGMSIVDALTWSWGTDRLPWGKRVWAELRDGQR